MKALETSYAGHRFRSRLEARWAVFFDALGVRWEYESEGVVTRKGPYLPDFVLHLKGGPLLFEVKPQSEVGQFDDRWALTAQHLKMPMVVAFGIPRPDRVDPCLDVPDLNGTLNQIAEQGGAPTWDNQFGFCLCPVCGAVGCTFNGRGGRVCVGCPTDDKAYTFDHPCIVAAYTAANSARFEHGESG